MVTPTASETARTIAQARAVCRVPHISRDRMSRPEASPPRRCPELNGDAFTADNSEVLGL